MTMRTWIGFAVLGVGLLACSNDSGDGGQGGGGTADTGCADITGNYDVTVTRVSGDCPTSDNGTTQASVTISSENSELYVVLPGINGGCKGTLDSDSCRFQAQCEITQNGATAVTYNVDYTFSGKHLSGSLVGAAAAGVLSDKACTATSKHEGSRL